MPGEWRAECYAVVTRDNVGRGDPSGEWRFLMEYNILGEAAADAARLVREAPAIVAAVLRYSWIDGWTVETVYGLTLGCVHRSPIYCLPASHRLGELLWRTAGNPDYSFSRVTR